MSWAVLPGSALKEEASSDSESDAAKPRYLSFLDSDDDDDAHAEDSSATAEASAVAAAPLEERVAAALDALQEGEEVAPMQQADEAPEPQAVGMQRSGKRPERYFTAPEPAGTPGSRRARTACYLCGDASHQMWECPRELCFICFQPGHEGRNCPTQRRSVVCGTCGRLGHERRDCKYAMRPSLAQCRCMVCGDYGHIDCAPYEERPKQPSCMNCGSAGHVASQCKRDGMDRWHKIFAQAAVHGNGGATPDRQGLGGWSPYGTSSSGYGASGDRMHARGRGGRSPASGKGKGRGGWHDGGRGNAHSAPQPRHPSSGISKHKAKAPRSARSAHVPAARPHR